MKVFFSIYSISLLLAMTGKISYSL